MKTYLVYGFGMALATSVLTLALYFLGYHSEAEKLGTAQWIISLGSLTICITGVILGTKARREELPGNENFSYGRALGAGVMTVLFASLFSVVTNYLYSAVINPGLTDMIVQAQVAKLEAKGIPTVQVEQAEKMIRMFSRPAIQAAFGFLGSMFFGTIVALISSAFLQRPARDQFTAA